MFKIFIYVLFVGAFSVHSSSVEDKIHQYFESDVFKAFQKYWQAHRRSFEHAIQTALKEGYGHRGMNVYIRRAANSLQITNGFYLSDNIIELLLLDTTLTSLPHMKMTQVTFALASNALKIEAGLSKMILETKYILFRNQSDIIYSKADQDPFKSSPFSYQQVQNIGQLAIVADDCTLVGYALVKLSGHSVNLGHDTFRVKGCKFSVEISTNNFGGPPVIAPYFSHEQRKQLEFLLMRPIREEITPKLQAALFTYINTSLIFGDYLPKFREYQNNIYKESAKHLNEIVRGINNQTVEMDKATVDLDGITVSWNDACQEEGSCWNKILISNVTLHGLDTLYSSHTGGPFKLQDVKIAESFRFNSMTVRGSIYFENNTITGDHEFVAEIRDFTINIEMELNKTDVIVDAMSWRLLQLSVIELENFLKNRKAAHSFIHGYLIYTMPGVLKDHVYNLFTKALKNLNNNRKELKESDKTDKICGSFRSFEQKAFPD